MQKLTATQIKKQLDLPSHWKLLGYVVNRIDTDEYLHNLVMKPDRILKWWTPTPERAKVYRASNKAVKALKRIPEIPCVASYLFDQGSQLIVYPFHIPSHLQRLMDEQDDIPDSELVSIDGALGVRKDWFSLDVLSKYF